MAQERCADTRMSVPGNGDKGDVISLRVVAFDGVVEERRGPRHSEPSSTRRRPSARISVIRPMTRATSSTCRPARPMPTEMPSPTRHPACQLAWRSTRNRPHQRHRRVRRICRQSVQRGDHRARRCGTDATDAFTWTIPAPPPPNQPPVVTSVSIDQAGPRTNVTLTTTVVTSDPEGADLTYAYQWSRNGTDITNATGPSLALSVAGNGDKGDTIGVRVTVSDGSNNTGPVNAAPVTVVNTPPTFSQNLGDQTDDEGDVIDLSADADRCRRRCPHLRGIRPANWPGDRPRNRPHQRHRSRPAHLPAVRTAWRSPCREGAVPDSNRRVHMDYPCTAPTEPATGRHLGEH